MEMTIVAEQPAIACPDCGCGHAQCFDSASYFGRTRLWYCCRHCGRKWSIMKVEPSASELGEFHYRKPQQCDDCGARGRVTSNRGRYRWVRCPECGKTWKELGIPV